MRSVRMQIKFSHPLFPRLFSIYNQQEGDKWIRYKIEEYIPGGALCDHISLHYRNIVYLSDADIFKIIYGITYGIFLMKSKGVMHRDINPNNIIYTHDHKVVIIDFGFAREFNTKSGDCDEQKQDYTNCGTGFYQAPELENNSSSIDYKVDIYSLGATIFSLLSNEIPRKVLRDHFDDFRRLNHQNSKYKWIDSFADTISRCASANPNERLEPEEIMDEIKVLANKKFELEDKQEFFDYVKELDVASNAEYYNVNEFNPNKYGVQVLSPNMSFPERGTLVNIQNSVLQYNPADLFVLGGLSFKGVGIPQDKLRAVNFGSVATALTDKKNNAKSFSTVHTTTTTNINNSNHLGDVPNLNPDSDFHSDYFQYQ